jgi:ribosome biogenesis protein Tsr3
MLKKEVSITIVECSWKEIVDLLSNISTNKEVHPRS